MAQMAPKFPEKTMKLDLDKLEIERESDWSRKEGDLTCATWPRDKFRNFPFQKWNRISFKLALKERCTFLEKIIPFFYF